MTWTRRGGERISSKASPSQTPRTSTLDFYYFVPASAHSMGHRYGYTCHIFQVVSLSEITSVTTALFYGTQARLRSELR